MNTQKAVYNKLFSKKTELETHKIELGAIQDLQKLENKFRKEVFPVYKEVAKAKDELRAKGSKAEATLNKIEQEIAQALKLIEKNAKDLGINISEIKEYKNVKALESIFTPARTVFKSVQ